MLAGDITFGDLIAVDVGMNPEDVLVADFNKDGHLDLAVANYAPGNVSVLLNEGDGTFAADLRARAGVGPYHLAAADLDDDGHLDLAVANYEGGNVSLLYGWSDGSFNLPIDYWAGGSLLDAVDVADLDQDGHLDLVAARTGTSDRLGGVSLLYGRGNGEFESAVDFFQDMRPTAVIAADINHDSIPDLVMANGFIFSQSNDVAVSVSRGDGTLAEPVHYQAGENPSDVALADFNGDGHPDIAAANASSNDVSLLMGNGDGTFQEAVNYANSVGTFSFLAMDISAGDLTGDGTADLAVTSEPSGVLVLINSGDGTFDQQQYVHLPDEPSAVELADISGDGRLDLIVTLQAFSTVGLLPNYIAGDANADGVFDHQDIVRVLQTGLYGTTKRASWAEGDWNGNAVFDQLDLVAALQTGLYSARAIDS
jgi:hypothetical protein